MLEHAGGRSISERAGYCEAYGEECVIVDPGQDTVTAYKVNWGDGGPHTTFSQSTQGSLGSQSAWTAQAPIAELVSTTGQFFPGVKPEVLAHAAERYRRLKIWKTSPVIEPAAMEKFEDILVQGHVLEPGKRVKFADLVVTEFFNKAK